MSGIQEIEGNLTIRSARIALLVSRFNSFVVESLLSGTIDTLKKQLQDAVKKLKPKPAARPEFELYEIRQTDGKVTLVPVRAD